MKPIHLAPIIIITCWMFTAVSCKNPANDKPGDQTNIIAPGPAVDDKNFEATIDGKAVHLYTLTNKAGARISITNYGGRIVSLAVPDKDGKPVDVVLGYDSLKSYQKTNEANLGALIGRYANRIANGKFTIDGVNYQTERNSGANTLHGGFKGFATRAFDAVQNGQALLLSYTSVDGEGGFPGNLSLQVTYTLTNENALQINYRATTDKVTVVNFTSHPYFNLSGEGSATALDHILQILAGSITPTTSTGIPTGVIKPVKDTPFDFTISKTIGKDITATDEQITFKKGYDMNFVLEPHPLTMPVALANSPLTGITLQVYTTEPGLQLYTTNSNITGKVPDGKGHKAYLKQSAFCLETQHYPDSPNQPSFPTTVLKPGEVYKSITIYKFLNK